MTTSNKLRSLIPVPPSLTVPFVKKSTDKDGKEKQTFQTGNVTLRTQFGGENIYQFDAVLALSGKETTLLSSTIDKNHSVKIVPNHGTINAKMSPMGEFAANTCYELFHAIIGKIEESASQYSDLGWMIFTGLVETLSIDEKTYQLSGYSPKALYEQCYLLKNKVTADNLPLFVFVNSMASNVKELPQSSDDMPKTKADLKQWLTDNKVEFSNQATLEELTTLYVEATKEPVTV
jgi:hypothetical protein